MGVMDVGDIWWRGAGLWALDSLNGGGAPALEEFLDASTADLFIFQETKALEHRLPGLKKRAERKGFLIDFAPALALPSGRPSGGPAVGTTSFLGVDPRPGSVVPERFRHRLKLARTCGLEKGGVHLVSIWLAHMEGLSA